MPQTPAPPPPTAGRARPDFDRAAAEAALAVAVHAPSVHNSQPWQWRLESDGLLLLADRDRQLPVADPDGHSLLVSCGATLALADLALRAGGSMVRTTRCPDPDNPDLLARVTVLGRRQPDPDAAESVVAALARRSDRRPFTAQPLSPHTIDALSAAANEPDVYVAFPTRDDQRIGLAVAISQADRSEQNDQAYQAEWRHWLRRPGQPNPTNDGIPLDTLPRTPPGTIRHSDVALRDFAIDADCRPLIDPHRDEHPLVAVIVTRADTPLDRLRSGEVLMRLMVQAQQIGLSTCALSQAVDFIQFRARTRVLLGWSEYPQMMVRIGYPSTSVAELPPAPRRPATAVLRNPQPNIDHKVVSR